MSNIGKIDLVIFSGDIAQKGSPAEFEKAGNILDQFWKELAKLGSQPILFVQPGNHDILRPTKLKPELLILKKWWEFASIHDEFFSDENSGYKRAADELLLNYKNWCSGLPSSLFDGCNLKEGWLAGDLSGTIQKGGIRIGLIGLNSTWLQIDGDDYTGKLHIDTRQLLSLTDGNPTGWCEQNDLNLLITHHPVDWLHVDSQEFWDSDINPAGRFDAHLFGHMHKPASRAISIGGSKPRRSIQGASLFGLTRTGTSLDRIHGYSIGQFTRTPSRVEAKVWPRILQTLESGSRKIVRDTRFDLDENDGSYLLFSRETQPPPSGNENSDSGDTHSSLQAFPRNDSDAILRKVRYHLPVHPAHANVRRVEQQSCLAALQQKRAVWLISEWGMSVDGFLSSVRAARNEPDRSVYKIDVSEFLNRDQLFDTIKRRLDCSLDRFCEILSHDAPNYLIFDNVNVSSGATSSPDDGATAELELEEVAAIILEYCPGLHVIFRSRKKPQHHLFAAVELLPLDEADLRSYVNDHERGGADLASQDTIIALHRHTDGIPIRVDQALKQLEVVTLPELVSSSFDVSMSDSVPVSSTAGMQPGLSAAVREFAASTDPTQQRAFALLKALSIFPQGEQLNRIKRFNYNAPFFPKHATELFDQGFIEVTTLQRLDTRADAQAKTLMVPRSIRECVRELIDIAELRELNRKAADLYFGRDWATGVMKSPPSYRFDNPNCPNGDIANANAIIVRLYNDASASDDEHGMARTLGLARSYLNALDNGDHYHSAVTFCDQLLPNVSVERFEEQVARLKARFGACLRMIGLHERAEKVLLEVEDYPLPSAARQSIFLNLALIYEDDDDDLACEYARRIISIDRNSVVSLQAQTILIERESNDSLREKKLAAHEVKCRRNGALVAANNIAITRAKETTNLEEKRKILGPVMVVNRDERDHYNQTRAVIDLSKITLNSGKTLNEKELSQLINAYHFLFNERIAGLFDDCHEALWKDFSLIKDQENLLTLFRHSSLYWRLRGRDDRELKYLKLMARDAQKYLVSKNAREAAYFQARGESKGVLELPTPTRNLSLPSNSIE